MKSVKFCIIVLIFFIPVLLSAYPIWVFDWESITWPYNIPHGTAKRISVVDDKLAWAVGDSGLVAKRDGPVYPGIGERVWEYVDISSFLPDPQDDYDFHDVFFFKNNNQLGWIVGELRSAQAPYDVYLIKTDANGLVGIQEEEREDAQSPRLVVFPNPFTTSTTFSLLGVSEHQNIRSSELTIYDTSGRMVKSVDMESNTCQLGADLVPGVYFLKATIGEHEEIQKLIKIR